MTVLQLLSILLRVQDCVHFIFTDKIISVVITDNSRRQLKRNVGTLGIMLLCVINQFLISWNKVSLMETEENRFSEVFCSMFRISLSLLWAQLKSERPLKCIKVNTM